MGTASQHFFQEHQLSVCQLLPLSWSLQKSILRFYIKCYKNYMIFNQMTTKVTVSWDRHVNNRSRRQRISVHAVMASPMPYFSEPDKRCTWGAPQDDRKCWSSCPCRSNRCHQHHRTIRHSYTLVIIITINVVDDDNHHHRQRQW